MPDVSTVNVIEKLPPNLTIKNGVSITIKSRITYQENNTFKEKMFPESQ